MIKSLRKKIKKLSTSKYGRKIFDKIRSFLASVFDEKLAPNTKHDGKTYADFVLYTALTEGSAEHTYEVLEDEEDIPSSDRVMDILNRFTREEVNTLTEELLGMTMKEGKKQKVLKHKIDIAIDPTDVPYYGKHRKWPWVIGTKQKLGTNYAYSYVCTESIVKGERFTIHIERRTMITTDDGVIKKSVKTASKCPKTGVFVLDREFHNVKVVKDFYRREEEFVIKAMNTSRVKRLKEENKDNLPCIVDYEMVSQNGETVNTKLGLVEGRNSDVCAFITNLNDSTTAGVIYDSRWGVETGHRERNKFRAITTSHNGVIRELYFALSALLQNIWVLVNIVATKQIFGKPDDPVVRKYSVRRFFVRYLEDVFAQPAYSTPI